MIKMPDMQIEYLALDSELPILETIRKKETQKAELRSRMQRALNPVLFKQLIRKIQERTK